MPVRSFGRMLHGCGADSLTWRTRRAAREANGAIVSTSIEDFVMAYEAASERYSQMEFRTCGKSGLKLPALSLGLWHNFGDTPPISTQRDILPPAFELGITQFDLANIGVQLYRRPETKFA